MSEKSLTFLRVKLSRLHRRNYRMKLIFKMLVTLMVIGGTFFCYMTMTNFDHQFSSPEYLRIYDQTFPHQANITATYDLKSLSFTSTINETFRIPTDIKYLAKWGCNRQYFREVEEAEIAKYGEFIQNLRKKAGVVTDGKFVRYFRDVTDIAARGKLGNCTPALDVLAWLMDRVNAKNGTLMIQAGGLIHVHREKDFINSKTKKFIDDDIDLWASLETVVHVGQLESELFSRFGWTMRGWINSDNYLVFINIIASCKHPPKAIPNNVKSSQPGLEIYPLAIIPIDGNRVAKDLWEGTQLPVSMVYPLQHIHFNSSGVSEPLHLQLPHKSMDILECMYGNWKVPSKKHAKSSILCK